MVALSLNLVDMMWNKSYLLLGYNSKSIALFDGTNHKIYSNLVQYDVLRELFDTKEITLDQVIKAFEDRYPLQDILEAFYGFIQDGLVILHPLLKAAIACPEEPSLLSEIDDRAFIHVKVDFEHPDVTVFVLSDLLLLQKETFLNLKSKQFTIAWILWNEIKLFPLFETSDTMSFFCFLARIKRVYYRQLLTRTNKQQVFSDFEPKSAIKLILDYLPNFIHSGEAQNTLLIFEKERLKIQRISLPGSLIKASSNPTHDIVDARGEPADVISVFKQLAFHVDETLGLVSKLSSRLAPFGGWVSSAGDIYRSNKVSAGIFFSKGRASGNGLTKDEAEAKAFCETLERFSQVFRENEDDYRIDKYENLGSKAIHPDDVLLYSAEQYLWQTATNQTGDKLVPFSEQAPISWSSVKDSSSGAARWLPTFLLYLGGPPEDPFSEKFFKWVTNGTAAGATLEMARLHALYELIERDAYAIWWYNRLNGQGIDIQYISHLPIVNLAISEHAKSGKSLYIIDITQDIGIPTVAVVSDYLEGTYVLACGSNISLEKACVKAFNELNQLCLYHMAKRTRLRDDQIQDILETLSNHKPGAPEWELGGNALTIAEELSAVENTIRKRGLQIYYKDLSRNDVLLPVVKAIVPGMRDLDTRFAPGRLFSVVQDLHGYMPAADSFRNFNLYK